MIRIRFPEAKKSLSDSNHSFEDSNRLYQEPEKPKFNLSDLNHSFENSNRLTISGLKLFVFFKWTVSFNKHIFAPLSNHSQTQSKSAFKLFFFKTHTHTHLISSFLIISSPKYPKSIMEPSQPKEPKMKSTVGKSLKEMGRG